LAAEKAEVPPAAGAVVAAAAAVVVAAGGVVAVGSPQAARAIAKTINMAKPKPKRLFVFIPFLLEKVNFELKGLTSLN
jgi:hypothetical protein